MSEFRQAAIQFPGRARGAPAALICVLALALSWAGSARADADPEMRSLDQQVQEMKSDVLAIAAELRQLEERLLYPSGTQVAVFVSLAAEEGFELGSVQIHIDGEPVAQHIYSFKELEALQKGGVQRIYTGNVSTGEHRLDVTMAGRLSSGREVIGSQSFRFEKEVEPKRVGITLAGASGEAGIELGSW